MVQLAPRTLTLDYENQAHLEGFASIAGCDEVGRGAIAGPVAAAGVILDPKSIPDGIKESKQLSTRKLCELFQLIMQTSTVAIAIAEVEFVDSYNVSVASLWAMAEAVRRLPRRPDLVLVDGRPASTAIPQISRSYEAINCHSLLPRPPLLPKSRETS